MGLTQQKFRPALTYVVPATVVVATLIALFVLPLITATRTERLRKQIERAAEPARGHLNEVNYQLGVQITSLNRAALADEKVYLEQYRRAGALRDRALSALAGDVRLLDDNAVKRLRELNTEITLWDISIERYLETRLSDDDAVVALIEREASYTRVIGRIKELDEAVSQFQAQRRVAVRRLMRQQVQVAIALLAMALIAASAVIWLVMRLRNLARQLGEESQQRMGLLESEREARSAAESLVRARDEILGIVSHDLRGPLTTISLSTQLLRDSSGDELAEHVETILATTRQMQRLIQDLLDAVKSEVSSLAMNPEMIHPAEVAHAAVHAHLPIAAEKQISLLARIEENLPEISADRDRLLQALSNLLGNALKFTPEGGTIHFRTNARDGLVRFQVVDSGPGIAPSDFPHLFEPFWQGKKTAHLGAGLGLKISRAIAVAHGGSIEVANEPEGGARFTLLVPVEKIDPE